MDTNQKASIDNAVQSIISDALNKLAMLAPGYVDVVVSAMQSRWLDPDEACQWVLTEAEYIHVSTQCPRVQARIECPQCGYPQAEAQMSLSLAQEKGIDPGCVRESE